VAIGSLNTNTALKARVQRAFDDLEGPVESPSVSRPAREAPTPEAKGRVDATTVAGARRANLQAGAHMRGALEQKLLASEDGKTSVGHLKGEASLKEDANGTPSQVKAKAEGSVVRAESENGAVVAKVGAAAGAATIDGKRVDVGGRASAAELTTDFGGGTARLSLATAKAGLKVDTRTGLHAKAGAGATLAEAEARLGKLREGADDDIEVTGYGAIGPKGGVELGVTDRDGDGVSEYRAGLKVPLGPVSIGASIAVEGETLGDAMKNLADSTMKRVASLF
jgi:hypothetical protein